MKRSQIVMMDDEYLFRETLSRAKLSDDQKVSIIRERQEYLHSNGIVKHTESIPIGPYRDPLTGIIRFNTGR